MQREDGNAMVLVVLTTSVAALFTLTAVTSAAGGLRQGVEARHDADARSLADAGASRALGHLTDDRSYTTHPAGAVIDRAWVLAAGMTAPLEVSVGGEFAWVVPAGTRELFGIGYVPTRAAPKETVVVRVAYDLIDPTGFGAVATAGDLTIDGTAIVTGLGGSIHSDGDLAVLGASSIAGTATASGTFTRSAAASIGGAHGGGQPSRLIPATDPRAYRALASHDLCPDTTVRLATGAPCTGTIQGNGVLGWRGWTFSGTTWSMHAGSATDGALYVHHGSASISGAPGTSAAPWKLTLITGSLRVGGVAVNGDVTITGNLTQRPFTSGIGIIADRDLAINNAGSVEGLVIAGEQIILNGSLRLRGQILATSASTSATSPVVANRIEGSVRIDAESAAPQITGGVEPTDWATF